MQNQIPHIKHRTRGSYKQLGFIEIDGEFIHDIKNLDEFYRAFGYSVEIAKAGILPDEFIWTEYIKDAPLAFTNCLQIHIIEYLLKHSDTFREKYRENCADWISAHVEAVTARGVLCATCRMKPYCSRREAATDEE
jgi:hypothetical protein